MTPVQLPEVPAPSAWAMTDYQPEANTQFTMREDAAEHYASVGLQVEPLYTAAQLREYATITAQPYLRVLAEARRAIGDHIAPEHCYATGPMTGDPYRDLIECPACSFIAMYGALIAPPSETNSER